MIRFEHEFAGNTWLFEQAFGKSPAHDYMTVGAGVLGFAVIRGEEIPVEFYRNVGRPIDRGTDFFDNILVSMVSLEGDALDIDELQRVGKQYYVVGSSLPPTVNWNKDTHPLPDKHTLGHQEFLQLHNAVVVRETHRNAIQHDPAMIPTLRRLGVAV